MAVYFTRIEIDLTIRKLGAKPRDPQTGIRDEKAELIETEVLTYKGISVREAIKKLIDFITDW